jgi:hypothetical protein
MQEIVAEEAPIVLASLATTDLSHNKVLVEGSSAEP